MKRFLDILKRLGKDKQGVAYFEFILALPILLLLFVGAVDLTRMVLIHQKVDRATFTVADLLTQLRVQQENVCPTLNQINTEVIRDVIKPFSYKPADYGLIVSSVIGSSLYGPLVEWRATAGSNYNFSDSRIGPNGYGPATVPPSLNMENLERLLVSEMWYRYEPLLPWDFDVGGTRVKGTDAHVLSKFIYMRGRNSNIADNYMEGTASKAVGCSSS